jgi:hypothetical protein
MQPLPSHNQTLNSAIRNPARITPPPLPLPLSYSIDLTANPPSLNFSIRLPDVRKPARSSLVSSRLPLPNYIPFAGRPRQLLIGYINVTRRHNRIKATVCFQLRRHRFSPYRLL